MVDIQFVLITGTQLRSGVNSVSEPAFSLVIDIGKMGVHLSADSSGILKVEKAESVIEVWEDYEVDVPVELPKENVTIESRETLETDGDGDNEEVSSGWDVCSSKHC